MSADSEPLTEAEAARALSRGTIHEEQWRFAGNLGEPWKLTIRNNAGRTIEFTLDELYEIARWLKSNLRGEAPRS